MIPSSDHQAHAGILVNAGFGWWWADPIAALAMVPTIVSEGITGLRANADADDCCWVSP